MRKRECGSFAPALPFSRYFCKQQCATAISTPPPSPPPLRFAAGTMAHEEASGSHVPETIDGGLWPPNRETLEKFNPLCPVRMLYNEREKGVQRMNVNFFFAIRLMNIKILKECDASHLSGGRS
jgi:hypothetical protein